MPFIPATFSSRTDIITFTEYQITLVTVQKKTAQAYLKKPKAITPNCCSEWTEAVWECCHFVKIMFNDGVKSRRHPQRKYTFTEDCEYSQQAICHKLGLDDDDDDVALTGITSSWIMNIHNKCNISLENNELISVSQQRFWSMDSVELRHWQISWQRATLIKQWYRFRRWHKNTVQALSRVSVHSLFLWCIEE